MRTRAGGARILSTICAHARRSGSDRKSTRLNSSHGYISYAVFCLKKKKNTHVLRRRLAHELTSEARPIVEVSGNNIDWLKQLTAQEVMRKVGTPLTIELTLAMNAE